MVDSIYNAAFSSSEELLTEFEKVYLLGQSQKEIYTGAVEYAIACQHLPAIENLFKLDVSRIRHLTEKDVDVNAIGPSVISRAIRGERTDVEILRLFLDLGMDVRKLFGNQGDVLMWAVRLGRWELIERILDQRGSFDVDQVKVSQKYRVSSSSDSADRLQRYHIVPQIRPHLHPPLRRLGPNPHSRRTPPLRRPRH
jgi:hypothetical protein